MRGGMTEYEERIGIFFGEYLQLTSWSSGRRKSISSPAPSLGAATRATSAASARRGEIPLAMSAGVVPLGHFLYLAVRQCDVNRLHALFTRLERH